MANAVALHHGEARRATSSVRPEVALALSLSLSVFGLLVSNRVSLVGEAMSLMVGASVARHARRPLSAATAAICVLIYLLLLAYLITAFGSNFPGFYPFLLGLRKSVPAWIFLAFGALWPMDRRAAAVRCLLLLLTAGCAVSIVLHMALPSIEDSVSRRAAAATATYNHDPRLQGVFAGPFHASLAGAALVLAAATLGSPFFSRRVRLAIGAVGLITVVEAAVRTAWVALALSLLICALLAPRLAGIRGRMPRVVLLVGCAIVGVSMNLQELSVFRRGVIGSLAHWQTDPRLLNRVQYYAEAKSLFLQRPLLGWGAGSAGDTLDSYFSGLVHVTPHDLFVKYAVEAGVVGVLIILAMVLIVGTTIIRTPAQPIRTLAVGLFAAFLLFGATGSAVDAVPVSWIVLFVVGAAIPPRRSVEDAVPVTSWERTGILRNARPPRG